MELMEYKGFEIKIDYDEYADNPRDLSTLSTVVAISDDYALGEIQYLYTSRIGSFNEDMLHRFAMYATGEEYRPYLKRRIILWVEKNIISLPIYDKNEDQIGYIFAKRDDILREYGYRYLTKKRTKFIKAVLNSELVMCNHHLRGDVHAYTINEGDVGSNGGYYGTDHTQLIKDAKRDIDEHIIKTI